MTPTSPSDPNVTEATDAAESADVQDLFIDSNFVRPLPKDLFDSECTNCAQKQSKWAIQFVDLPDPMIMCSKCFLYLSAWATPRQKELTEIVAEIEAMVVADTLQKRLQSGTTMTAEQIEALQAARWERDADGHLVDCRRCDDVMGKIYLLSRIHTLEMRKMQQMSESRIIMPSMDTPQFSPIPLKVP